MIQSQTPIIALTATATERVCADLKEILNIGNCELFRRSINRPNLFYEMARKPPSAEEQTKVLMEWIRTHYGNGESGIVYCLTQKDTEQMAAKLSANGIAAAFYHANMDPSHRESVHLAWSCGDIQVKRPATASSGTAESLLMLSGSRPPDEPLQMKSYILHVPLELAAVSLWRPMAAAVEGRGD